MRSRPSLVPWLAVAALCASACNLVFGIHGGEPAPSGNTGGAHPDGGSPDAAPDHEGGTGGTGGSGGAEAGAPCVADTATCVGAVLHACDATGHLAPPITCPVVAACDGAARACIDAAHFGRLSVGLGRACAIEDDRTVRCWGNNGGGLLMSDPHDILPTAHLIPGVAGVRQISVGANQQCALQDDGSMVCWGSNDSGELAIPPGGNQDPMTVAGIAGVVEVSAARRCTCARLADGTVTCWGAEDTGCLGVPTPKVVVRPPAKVPGVTGAVQLRAGAYSVPSCARQISGKVLCWSPEITPSAVPGVDDAVDVAVGFGVVFIRSATKGVLWSAPTPAHAWSTAVSYGISGTITAMGAGDTFIALRADGVVLYAHLDGGSPPPLPAPMTGQPAGTVAEIAVGSGLAYDQGLQCLRLGAVPLASGVLCWGDDAGGALGANAPHLFRHATSVPNVLGVTSLTTAQSSTHVVMADGSAAFWGTSYTFFDGVALSPHPLGFLGNANRTVVDDDSERAAYILQQSGVPTLIIQGTATPTARLLASGFTDFVDARPWNRFDVGLRANGTIVVYGSLADANTEGVFGDGTTTATAQQTVTVPGISTATAVASYGDDYSPSPAHLCAILGPSGALSCWGGNGIGEVGVGVPGPGVTVKTPTKVSIPGNEAIVSVAAGSSFTCAASATGKVYCWGLNDYGQLGSPGTSSSPVPLAVSGVTTAVGVSARAAYVCALLADKTVTCWGRNDRGQLGDGTLDDQDHPVAVTGLQNVVEVSASVDHTCARRGDGTVACWGSSYDGQVGTGVVGVYATPLAVQGL